MRYSEREMEDHPESEKIESEHPDALEELLTDFRNGKITQEECSKQLRVLIDKDFLTGLLNRKGIREALDRELRIRQRDNFEQSQSEPIAVLFIDGDRIKWINDTHGHEAGSEAIRAIGSATSASASRPADAVGRDGGDEFVAMLPGTSLQGALVVAEGIRQNVEQIAQSDPRFIGLSVSIGVVLYSKGMTADKLIKHADAAMYQAKKGDKNSIAIHPGSLPREASALDSLTVFIQKRGIKTLPIGKPEPVSAVV